MEYQGLKTEGGKGQPKEKRETKWISRGLQQGAGQPKEKEKTNGLVRAKKRGWGGPILGKKRKQMDK